MLKYILALLLSTNVLAEAPLESCTISYYTTLDDTMFESVSKQFYLPVTKIDYKLAISKGIRIHDFRVNCTNVLPENIVIHAYLDDNIITYKFSIEQIRWKS